MDHRLGRIAAHWLEPLKGGFVLELHLASNELIYRRALATAAA